MKYVINKPISLLIAVLVISSCTTNNTTLVIDEGALSIDEEALVALTSQELNLVFIKEGFREVVAEKWEIEDPSASHWDIMVGEKLDHLAKMEIATISTIKMRKVPYKIGDKGVYYGRLCTGNSPAVEGQCIRRPSGAGVTPGVNNWYRRDILGYSFCVESGSPDDTCEVVYSNTAYWANFSDQCQTISRRYGWHRPRWICIQ